MKYDYSVKANGKWYKPGEEVPDNTEKDTTVTTADTDILTATETNEPEKKSGKKKN